MLRGLWPVDIALALESKAAKPESFPSTVANCPLWPSPLTPGRRGPIRGSSGFREDESEWMDPRPQTPTRKGPLLSYC